MTDCLICRRHYSQGGGCSENKRLCLAFDEEPRGKMIRTSVTFKLDSNAETPIVKYGSKVMFEDSGEHFELEIIKINWINLKQMTCNVDVKYHENDMPRFEKRKKLKIIK